MILLTFLSARVVLNDSVKVSVGRRITIVALLPLCACATARSRIDLEPARAAVRAAHDAPAGPAAEALGRAEVNLRAAEAATGGTLSEAEALARLAVAEANCALALSDVQQRTGSKQAGLLPFEAERAAARGHKPEDDQRRLEDRIAQLQLELELTETEVIRTKARLKGNETKAEASSAIAEARILLRRVAHGRGGAVIVTRGQELIARAELLLTEDNYGAAAFFALKAQDIALKAQGDESPSAAPLRAPPQKRYVVKVAQANVRRGPAVSEPVIARVARGTTIDAIAIRGDWVQVSLEPEPGWIHRALLE